MCTPDVSTVSEEMCTADVSAVSKEMCQLKRATTAVAVQRGSTWMLILQLEKCMNCTLQHMKTLFQR